MRNNKRFKKVMVAAAAFSAALNLHACAYGPAENFDPRDNVNDDVYGPPAFFESETSDTPNKQTDIPDNTEGVESEDNESIPKEV